MAEPQNPDGTQVTRFPGLVSGPAPPASSQPGGLVPPDVLLKQIREQFPELHGVDDSTVLKQTLARHPEWKTGVPKGARQSAQPQTGLTKATGISGPRTWGEAARENLATIGAAGGAILGGGVPGAAVGAAVGESGRLLLRQNANLPVADSGLMGLGPTESIIEEGALGGLTEAGGSKVVGTGRKVLGGVFHEAMQEPGAQATRAAAEKFGLKMSAPEIAGKGDSMALKLGHSGYFGLGRNVTEKVQSEARQQIVGAVEQSLKKFDSTLIHPGQIVYSIPAAGEATQGGLTIAHQVFQQEDNRLYRAVDSELQKLVTTKQVTKPVTSTIIDPTTGKPSIRQATSFVKEGLQVDMKPLRLYIAKQLEQIQEIAPTLQGLAGQDKSLLTFANAIKQLPDSVNFENANAIRSNMLSELRKINDLLPGKFKGLEKTVTKLLDRQMENTAQKGGAPVLKAWRAANSFHAEGARIFQDSIVADLTNKTLAPENVFKKLGSDQVTDAKALMEGFTRYDQHALPAEKVAMARTRDVFRQGYLSSMFEDSMTKLGQGARADLTKILTKNKPVLDVLLAGDPKAAAVRTDLNQLARFLDSQAKISGLSHWGLFELLAGAGTAFWGGRGSSSTLLGAAEAGPFLLTKILYNKQATKFLLDGLVQLPKGTDKAGPAVLRAIRIAMTSGTPHEEPGQEDKNP